MILCQQEKHLHLPSHSKPLLTAVLRRGLQNRHSRSRTSRRPRVRQMRSWIKERRRCVAMKVSLPISAQNRRSL
nr:MAG TPA: hypothetical protein [Caudoviricetes sp.]